MKLICLQAGHENISNNCSLNLRSSTGAPGEAAFTVRIRNRLSEILISKGFQVQLVDANYNCDPEAPKKDFDLFLAIHYDADSPNGSGGCIGTPDPSQDSATLESVRIRDVMRSEYFKNTGINENNNKIGANILYYYMWADLSAKTPCVLIECGEGKDSHDSVILADTDRVCNAIARGICKAFDMPFDVPAPIPTPQPQDDVAMLKTTIDNLNQIINDKNRKIADQAGEISSLETEVINGRDRIASLTEQAKKVPDLQTQLEQALSDRNVCLTAQATQNKTIAQLRNSSYTTASSKVLLNELFRRLAVKSVGK